MQTSCASVQQYASHPVLCRTSLSFYCPLLYLSYFSFSFGPTFFNSFLSPFIFPSFFPFYRLFSLISLFAYFFRSHKCTTGNYHTPRPHWLILRRWDYSWNMFYMILDFKLIHNRNTFFACYHTSLALMPFYWNTNLLMQCQSHQIIALLSQRFSFVF